ncbi:MAG: AAA family ATPase [Gammaproteobacteria bacterium]|nr:AAA family ATPase [Gammaproteobacteria bacterium]
MLYGTAVITYTLRFCARCFLALTKQLLFLEAPFTMSANFLARMRVYLSGASSSGKSMLQADLASKFPSHKIITEVARDLMAELHITLDDLMKSLATDKKLFGDLQVQILDRQLADTDRYTAADFISDRGPDALVYTKFYVPARYDEVRQSAAGQAAVQRCKQPGTLVVLVSPHGQGSRDDGTRLAPSDSEAEQFTDCFREFFGEERIEYLDLRERDVGRRVELVAAAMEGM